MPEMSSGIASDGEITGNGLLLCKNILETA
jgi:hypothetical protein